MHCYRCGRHLDSKATHLRRRVAVGEWSRQSYGRGGGRSIIRKTGMRVVCDSCAKWVDATEVRNAAKQWIQLGIVLLVLAITLVMVG